MNIKLIKLTMILILFICQIGHANKAPLFNVTASGSSLNIVTTAPGKYYSNAGIKINTPSFSLSRIGTECTPNKNGYCLFSVSDTQIKNLSIAGGTGTINITLCLDGIGGNSCQNYSLFVQAARNAKYLYVVNENVSTSVYVCALDQITGNISSCQDAGQSSVLGGNVQGINLNSSSTMAYVTSELISVPQLFQCAINPTDGTFSACSEISLVSPSNYTPYYGSVILNTANTIAYIQDSNSGGRILACPVALGIISSNCTDTGATNAEQYMTGIEMNKASTLAYIANGYSTNTVTVCSVSNNILSGCTPHDGDGSITFSQPTDITLNSSESLLYIVDSPNIYACTPSFSNCFVAGTVSSGYGIDINEKGTMAYVSSSYDTEVYQCPILLDGTFSSCTSNPSFNSSVSVVLGY